MATIRNLLLILIVAPIFRGKSLVTSYVYPWFANNVQIQRRDYFPKNPWNDFTFSNGTMKQIDMMVTPKISREISDIGMDENMLSRRRRSFFRILTSVATIMDMGYNAKPAFSSTTEQVGTYFRRDTDQFKYELQVPYDFNGPNQKPLKTHFDEVNFKSNTIAGFEIGITVDPVRISSLTEFGTPEQVAAKVVLAEVNRDGVLEVKLLDDPVAGTVSLKDGSTATFYQLNYLSNGKRGRKRYIAKFFIQNQKLFAMTVQGKEDTYEMIKQDVDHAVTSFRIV
jgi:hypothetical protein